MNRLIDENTVCYDSMIIIYYCFNIKNHEIIEFTLKSHKLTEHLLKNNINISVPSFVISEIERQDISKMVEKFTSSNQITNIPSNLTLTFKFGLELKFKNKLHSLIKKEWFIVEDYYPPLELLEPLNFLKIHYIIQKVKNS